MHNPGISTIDRNEANNLSIGTANTHKASKPSTDKANGGKADKSKITDANTANDLGTKDVDGADNSGIGTADAIVVEKLGRKDANGDNNLHIRKRPSGPSITNNAICMSLSFLRRAVFLLPLFLNQKPCIFIWGFCLVLYCRCLLP